jgi:hypothetical protein
MTASSTGLNYGGRLHGTCSRESCMLTGTAAGCDIIIYLSVYNAFIDRSGTNFCATPAGAGAWQSGKKGCSS